MERYELLQVDWYQDGKILFVHIKLTFLEICGKLLDGRIRLDETHILLLLFLCAQLDFTIIKSLD